MKISLFLATLAVSSLVASCRDTTACESPLRNSLEVMVVDSLTGDSIGRGASLAAYHHESSTTVRANHPDNVGYDRIPLVVQAGPGTFDLSVTKPGYATWTRAGVVVNPERCNGTKTVALTAKLRTLTGGAYR